MTNFVDTNANVIGISLNSSYSNCGVYNDDKIELIQFQNGSSCLPNFVCYNTDDTDILVGEQAKKKVFSDFRFFDSFEMLGLSYEEVLSLSKYKKYPFKIVNDDGIPKFETKYNKEVVYVSSVDITCEILKYIKKSVDNKLENDINKITKAIVTIPKYYSEVKRGLIKQAAKIVGIEIIEFVDEIKSSLVSMNYINNTNKHTVNNEEIELMLNLDETSFCCYLVKVNYNEKEYEILRESIIMEINGYEITKRIENFILNIYEKETGNSRDTIEVKKLLQLNKVCNEARQLLCLGIENEYEVSWSVLMNEGIDRSITVDDFNKMCGDIFDRIVVEIDKLSLGNRIDGIIEIGDFCKYKRFEEIVRSKYSNEIVFKDINNEDICCCGSVIIGNLKEFNFNKL